MGPEFRVNTYTTNYQSFPSVASGSTRNFIVVWESNTQDGSDEGIFGQRYGVAPAGVNFYTLVPCRVVDTRNPIGTYGGPALQPDATRDFPLNGQCGLPADALAVAANIAVANPTAAGDLRLYPPGGAVPLVSTINFGPGQVRANNAILGVMGTPAGTDRPLGRHRHGGLHPGRGRVFQVRLSGGTIDSTLDRVRE